MKNILRENDGNIKIAVTLCLILATGIIFRQSFLRMLPLFISLFIMKFQAKANRYSYLAGGLNSLLYAFVYLYLGLYASAATVILFSFPIQILTFINWSRHPYQKTVEFKKMTAKQRLAVGALFIALWVIVLGILISMNSQYAILDNTASLLSICVSILTMLAYIEYAYLWLVSSALSIALNFQVMLNDPSHITFLIYTLYSFTCVISAFRNVRRLYAAQQTVAD